MDEALRRAALAAQRSELTEHLIYKALAARASGHNRSVLETIANDELRHHEFWHGYTGESVEPDRWKVRRYVLLARIFGFIFALRLMESAEEDAQATYARLNTVKGLKAVLHDEERHEKELIAMLKEERLEYAGSIVLGLNDALVELTGALAGLTLALRDHMLVALAGLVTGLAASLSMAASAYLHEREEQEEHGAKSPLKAATYTGITYLLTVILLILPFFLVHNIYAALATTIGTVVVIIASYTFYITVAKGERFWGRFVQMLLICLIVAAISFGVGLALRAWLGIEV